MRVCSVESASIFCVYKFAGLLKAKSIIVHRSRLLQVVDSTKSNPNPSSHWRQSLGQSGPRGARLEARGRSHYAPKHHRQDWRLRLSSFTTLFYADL